MVNCQCVSIVSAKQPSYKANNKRQIYVKNMRTPNNFLLINRRRDILFSPLEGHLAQFRWEGS